MEEFTNVHYVALWGFGIAVVFGFVANKTHFCVMGAISDVIHMGSKGRLGAWLLAMGIAVLGTQALQLAGIIDVGESRYLGPNFMWLSYIVGGVLFGIALIFGMITGSFVYAVISRNFRIETFSNRAQMVSHLVGGALMGFGGILSVGCTIGQGVTGMSSLAMGSLLATVAIVFGSALTMKVEYYLLDEIGFGRALTSALVDLIIPGRGESA